jgi:DNA primase
MARIPEEQIEQLKQDVSLLTLVKAQGYELTKQGKNYVLNCPFHEEKTPIVPY